MSVFSSDIIGFKFVAYKSYRLWVLGVNHIVISIPLFTSLFYLLHNSYRGVLVICSVPELHHPYLETRSGTRPQPFCHTLAGPIFMILNLHQRNVEQPPHSDSLTQLLSNLAFLILPAAITQAIYCGLGHFGEPAISSSNTNSALYQLIIFERMLGYLRDGGRTISEVYFQSSEFREVEVEFLRSRGYTVPSRIGSVRPSTRMVIKEAHERRHDSHQAKGNGLPIAPNRMRR